MHKIAAYLAAYLRLYPLSIARCHSMISLIASPNQIHIHTHRNPQFDLVPLLTQKKSTHNQRENCIASFLLANITAEGWAPNSVHGVPVHSFP